MNKAIIQVISNHTFDTTYNNLIQAIDNNPKLSILTEIDHSKNASTVGLSLEKSRVILFGNPSLGTLLMNSNIVVGLDLPQKFLVFEKGSDVFVAYNDPMYMKQRYKLTGDGDVQLLDKISTALKRLVEITT